MRLPHLQRYIDTGMDDLTYGQKFTAVQEKGLSCIIRSTAVSRGSISDGMVIFDSGRPVASYLENNGERLFGDGALQGLGKVADTKKAVTEVFTLSKLQISLIIREDDRLLLKKGVLPKPKPQARPKIEPPAPAAVPKKELKSLPPEKKADVISKISNISRKARLESPVGKDIEQIKKEIPKPVEIEPESYSLLDVPQEFAQEKAMELIVEERGGRKLTEREILEFGQIIFGSRLDWYRGIVPELMEKFGISRTALLKSYRLSDPSASEVDKLMAEFYDVDREDYSEFKKEISDGIVKEASRIPGVSEVTCMVNFVFDEELKTNYPELLIEASFSPDTLKDMGPKGQEITQEKISGVAGGVLEKSLSVRKVDVSPEKKKVSVNIKEKEQPKAVATPAVSFIKVVEVKLSEVFNEAMVNHLITWHLDSLGVSRDSLDKEKAHEFVLALIPDIVAQSGIMEGLKISQEIKNLYKQEYQ